MERRVENITKFSASKEGSSPEDSSVDVICFLWVRKTRRSTNCCPHHFAPRMTAPQCDNTVYVQYISTDQFTALASHTS
jgi:hypothetical protein